MQSNQDRHAARPVAQQWHAQHHLPFESANSRPESARAAETQLRLKCTGDKKRIGTPQKESHIPRSRYRS
jgi:hypothetical protein